LLFSFLFVLKYITVNAPFLLIQYHDMTYMSMVEVLCCEQLGGVLVRALDS